jgi:hypothetical protein
MLKFACADFDHRCTILGRFIVIELARKPYAPVPQIANG